MLLFPFFPVQPSYLTTCIIRYTPKCLKHSCIVLGVTNLRALLAREKDEDTPRLSVLLCEAFVASYMSLVVYALATCDSLILYRLAGQKFTNQTWAMLFGGGVKKLLKVAASSNSTNQVSSFC